jgi:hypothetical protein
MKLVAGMAAIMTLALVNTGCGGGGGGGGDSSSDPLIPLETSEIRAYKEGDTYTGTITFTDAATGLSASGEITETIGDIVQNPFGIDCRSVVYSGTLTGPEGDTVAYSGRELFHQDASNSVYDCGEFNEDLGRYVFLTDSNTSPNGLFLEIESPVQIGNTVSGVIFYDDGSWQDCTYTVLAIENVRVPSGFYESYKIKDSCSYSDGVVEVSDNWFVPSIYFIKYSGTIDGLSAEYELNSFNQN